METPLSPIQMIAHAFPREFDNDVRFVWEFITSHYPSAAADTIFPSNFAKASIWQLFDGAHINIPYRVYFADDATSPAHFSPDQQVIYHCILSRSYDGYVRERHIKALLDRDPPHWALPYIIKVCDEYVVEILQLVYTSLSGTDTSAYQTLCRLNLPQFVYSHARMVSYWNEYYRWDCYHYRNYVGKALFENCFGYTRSLEQFRRQANG